VNPYVICDASLCCVRKRDVESDDDIEDVAEEQEKVEEVEEDEIIESDVELEGETCEPDDDPPQKVLFCFAFRINIITLIDFCCIWDFC